MFDTITLRTPPTYAQHVNQTIHEHRAPTDESIRLAIEMREKVLVSIIESRVVADNTLSFAYDVLWNETMTGRVIWVKFTLNGEESMVHEEVDELYPHPIQALRITAEAIAGKIASEVFSRTAKRLR